MIFNQILRISLHDWNSPLQGHRIQRHYNLEQYRNKHKVWIGRKTRSLWMWTLIENENNIVNLQKYGIKCKMQKTGVEKSVENVYKSHEKRWNSRQQKTGSVIYENWAIEKHWKYEIDGNGKYRIYNKHVTNKTDHIKRHHTAILLTESREKKTIKGHWIGSWPDHFCSIVKFFLLPFI